jgi:hypothetical protein
LAANRRRIGQKASEETRAKLSAARKGRKQSPEQVAKRLETFRKNREKKIAAGLIAAPKARIPRGPTLSGKASHVKKPRVWSLEDRVRERQRALAQWTPEAKQAAKERATKQWTPEAREKVSKRMLARYANKKAERLAA